MVDGFGCTIQKLGTGAFLVEYKRALVDGAAPVVTAISDGIDFPLATANRSSAGSAASVRTFRLNNGEFENFDYPFYIQVVGRPE